MHTTISRVATVLGIAAVALTLSAPAHAAKVKTYRLSGQQITVDPDQGISAMTGSLKGQWSMGPGDVVATTPVFHSRGTEQFDGCLDRRRDGSCAGDPSGTLELSFDYFGLYATPDPASLMWGACYHPVTRGTGDFSGAEGVLMMVDTPEDDGVRTDYIGNLTLKRSHAQDSRAPARRARAALRGTC